MGLVALRRINLRLSFFQLQKILNDMLFFCFDCTLSTAMFICLFLFQLGKGHLHCYVVSKAMHTKISAKLDFCWSGSRCCWLITCCVEVCDQDLILHMVVGVELIVSGGSGCVCKCRERVLSSQTCRRPTLTCRKVRKGLSLRLSCPSCS